MESLALVVVNIFLGLIGVSLTTLVFSIVNRRSGKLRKTSIAIFIVQCVVAIWATSILISLGYIPVAGAVLSGLILFLPKRKSK